MSKPPTTTATATTAPKPKLSAAERRAKRNANHKKKVDALAKVLGPDGVRFAEQLITDFPTDVIKYAYLTDKRRAVNSAPKLGKHIDKLLGALPEVEARAVEQKLLAAKISLSK